MTTQLSTRELQPALLRRLPVVAPEPLLRAALDAAQNDHVSMARLRKGLDEFLERDRDWELFDLPPKPDSIKKAASESL